MILISIDSMILVSSLIKLILRVNICGPLSGRLKDTRILFGSCLTLKKFFINIFRILKENKKMKTYIKSFTLAGLTLVPLDSTITLVLCSTLTFIDLVFMLNIWYPCGVNLKFLGRVKLL